MTIRSEHPVNPGGIYAALVALGAEPVLDPDLWPEGPQEDDRLRLLGNLVTQAELELTAAVRMGEEQVEDLARMLFGVSDVVGRPDSDLAFAVLINRLQRTAVQLMDVQEETEETPPGRAASWAAVVASAELLGVHLAFQRSDIDGVRRALGRAESSVITVLENMHDLRVAIGDAEQEEE